MSNWRLKAPVVLIIFNRPDTTERVFAAIAKSKPLKLFVIGDGPRSDNPEDANRVLEARAIIKRVEWDCEVLTNFSDTNLGCKKRVVSGLDWVFANVDRSIILEDDVVPHESFFRYCDELLEKYSNDSRVGLITGTNFLPFNHNLDPYSYIFTRISDFNGWGTWSRVWKSYDPDIKDWPQIRALGLLEDIFCRNRLAVRHWSHLFQMAYSGRNDIWDYQLVLYLLVNNLMTIVPANNMISNIGYRPDATNTKDPTDKLANFPTKVMSFPLRHPPYLVSSTIREKQLFRDVWGITSRRMRLFRKISRCSGFVRTRNWMQLKKEFQRLTLNKLKN